MKKNLVISGSILLVMVFLATLKYPETFLRPYLFGFLFWSDLPLGAMGLLMIYNVTGGQWGEVTDRLMEAVTGTLPVIALFFCPILAGLSFIYTWGHGEWRLASLTTYLSPLGFLLRSVLYFTGWLYLRRGLLRPFSREKKSRLGAGGLVWLVLSVSFAAIDWRMSIESKWTSTVYGLAFITGETLTAYSFCLALACLGSGRLSGEIPLTPKRMRDLGNILLTLIMVWAYLSFMQYLIVWSGNLPAEVSWYNRRVIGGWKWLAVYLALMQFGFPFVFLLFRSFKENPKRLGALALFVFFSRVVDHYWLTLPAYDYGPFQLGVTALALWLGLGLLWSAAFLQRMSL